MCRDFLVVAGILAFLQPSLGMGATKVLYDPRSGLLELDTDLELTSFQILSESDLFGGSPQNLNGPFDVFEPGKLFKTALLADFETFGDTVFGEVLPAGLTLEYLSSDFSFDGSKLPEGGIGEVGIEQAVVPGDANGDGLVDELDLAIVLDNLFKSETTISTGDFNGDGSTDGSDFNIWNLEKSSFSTAFVPEPQFGFLVFLGLAAHLVRRLRF